ncbi:hypothetical protein IL306_007207 [Fusarium sp. DS 682]|nr:hypothetical protein IL306_007207 [Fusarium sp. DS 682]
MSASGCEVREVSRSQFHDHTVIHQGNIQGNVYYGTSPHLPAGAEFVRVIPYPRNEDLVKRQDLIDKLDKLLPQTSSGSHSAALWGLGGSGYVSTFDGGWCFKRLTNKSKTQIALDYAYRRCDADKEYCVFWVHADSEATFLADYKTIGKKLGVDERLDGTDLLDAVRNEIERRPKWLTILDNADDLRLFGVSQQAKNNETNGNLYKYIPHGSQGTVLWTSRDAHITGTLVGARRSVQVQSMEMDEATTLLSIARGDPPTSDEVGADGLLKELQCLPLAVSQTGAYMRRMSMTIEEYLSRLKQGKSRWEVLKVSDTDRHRRPEVSNSVLETWRISTERIREESEMSYRILHVIAYVDSQDIPHKLIAAAADQYDSDSEDDEEDGEDEDSDLRVSELEVLEAIARLKEFSFLSLRQTADGGRSYEMHKLVREALQYGLRISSAGDTGLSKASRVDDRRIEAEAFYSGRALQVVDDLFPSSEPSSWAQCEQYLIHAIQVGEWAEMNRTETETASLLKRVSYFLYERGRWREREPVDRRAWGLRRKMLGEKHPDTIWSMAYLAATYHAQGRSSEAEKLHDEALRLRREVLGEKHPDTIWSMASLAATYHNQGRYGEAERLHQAAWNLRRRLLGENHPDTIQSVEYLISTQEALQQLLSLYRVSPIASNHESGRNGSK